MYHGDKEAVADMKRQKTASGSYMNHPEFPNNIKYRPYYVWLGKGKQDEGTARKETEVTLAAEVAKVLKMRCVQELRT